MLPYWRCIHPHPATWLFYGATPEEPMTAAALREAFNAARQRVGLDRSVTFHSLRHYLDNFFISGRLNFAFHFK